MQITPADLQSPRKPGFLVAEVSGPKDGRTEEDLLQNDSRGMREQPKNCTENLLFAASLLGTWERWRNNSSAHAGL